MMWRLTLASLQAETAQRSCLPACRRSSADAGLDVQISRLYDAFKLAPERDLKPLWQDAISKTVAWCDSLQLRGERAS